jgi:hypothetical protein
LVNGRGKAEFGELFNRNVVKIETTVILVVKLARAITLFLPLLGTLTIKLSNTLDSHQLAALNLLFDLLLVFDLVLAGENVDGAVLLLEVLASACAIVN